MKASVDHIATSHVGSLPRPDGLIAAHRAHEAGEPIDEAAFQQTLREAVAEVVRHQRDIGIDIPGDGEFGKPMAQRVQYGSWWRYSWQRLGGLKIEGPSPYDTTPRRSRPGEVVLTSFGDRRDRSQFAAAYADPESGITTGPRPPAPVCVGPITYTGHDAIATDIANFKAAMQAAGVEEGFMSSVAPGSASRIANTYYKTEEELLYACADAMREEYKAIVDAGLVLQLDDPAIAENWDMVNPRTDGGGIQEVLDGPRRGTQPRDQGTARGPHPVPPVLGKLARPAHDRHPDAGHRRGHAGDQRGGVFVRGRQCAARA